MSPNRSRHNHRGWMSALLAFLIVGLWILMPVPQAGAIFHGKGPTLLEIRAKDTETILEETIEKIGGIQNISRIERYLLIKTKPHDVIGIEAGAPLRIISRDGRLLEGKVEAGRGFKERDEGKNFAIVGKIYAEDYGFKGTMAGMKHFFELGQSFKLREAKSRTRVIGGFSVSPESEAQKVFLPLTTAQKIYGMEGKLSNLFITVKSPGDMDQVKRDLEAVLGGTIEAISR